MDGQWYKAICDNKNHNARMVVSFPYGVNPSRKVATLKGNNLLLMGRMF